MFTSAVIVFLNARLDEQEQAQADTGGNGPSGWHDFSCALVASEGFRDCDCGVPTYVLADIAAKRDIVAHFPGDLAEEASWLPYHLILRSLACAYSSHPDFDPAWRVH